MERTTAICKRVAGACSQTFLLVPHTIIQLTGHANLVLGVDKTHSGELRKLVESYRSLDPW